MGGDVGPDPETAVGEGDVVVDDEGDEGGADVVVGVGAGAGAGGGVGFGLGGRGRRWRGGDGV